MTAGGCCPRCGYNLAGDPVEELRAECERAGLVVFAGDRVTEATAAHLLGRSPATLRNWRSGAGPLPAVRTGAGRGRVSYRLVDLALHLAQTDDFFT